jgi:hypothetical protein
MAVRSDEVVLVQIEKKIVLIRATSLGGPNPGMLHTLRYPPARSMIDDPSIISQYVSECLNGVFRWLSLGEETTHVKSRAVLVRPYSWRSVRSAGYVRWRTALEVFEGGTSTVRY